MSNVHKNKSRTRLYNAIAGAQEATGPSGVLSTWTIQFPNLAAVGDTYKIGDYYFAYVAEGSEDYTKAGTAADPVLVNIGTATPDATKAASALVLALHGFAGTAAWGFLYPIDATGASSSTDTVTIQFFPGRGSADGYVSEVSSVGTNATIVRTVAGVAPLPISLNHAYTVIDTTGGAQNKEYYPLQDGFDIGDTVTVVVKTMETGDTPTIVAKLTDGETAHVEALFPNGGGKSATFMWDGASWLLLKEGNGTTLTFAAAS